MLLQADMILTFLLTCASAPTDSIARLAQGNIMHITESTDK
jgi:hypothetical protein